MSENILEINNLSKYFGGLAAVSDCSIRIKKGTVIGALSVVTNDTEEFSINAGNPCKLISKRE